ncbi:MAG: preprotein translocase subunit SecG [Parcubacteria group bacterium Gr01-1014_70]|nr:MAG: preprotein translocase subunit SecG [Parcubacteria group bacterium Gr01-1014_70]
MVRLENHMTQQLLSYFQIGVAVLLGAAILLQQKGQGLSGAFGGEGGFYRTKRGLERILLISTIVLAVLFVGIGIARIVLHVPLSTTPTTPEVPAESPAFELQTEPAVDGNTVPVTIPDIEVEAEPMSQ